jgi:hypothetical protein
LIRLLHATASFEVKRLRHDGNCQRVELSRQRSDDRRAASARAATAPLPVPPLGALSLRVLRAGRSLQDSTLLERLVRGRGWIVLLGVLLFAISTAIAWSYYGDRCANYLFGVKAVLPYRIVYVVMHFVGAVAPLASIWALGDVFLGFVIFPNLLALLLLSPKVAELTKSYFERRPWEENARVHAEMKARKRERVPR